MVLVVSHLLQKLPMDQLHGLEAICDWVGVQVYQHTRQREEFN